MLSLSKTRNVHKLEILLNVIQDLSLTRSIAEIMQIVRSAARELVDSDGATFVLKDAGMCYYADEDAISPLWKGKRFPMSTCISGWVMINKSSAVIPNIYADDRIPHDAYRPTFVKSLSMVPIRTKDPIGAIGTYWSEEHTVDDEQLQLLQALADSTSIAIENVLLYQDLEKKVKERTAEIESFSYSVSHDLKAPVRSILGFTDIVKEELGTQASPEILSHLNRITNSAEHMSKLIVALLDLSRISRLDLQLSEVNLSDLATEVCNQLKAEEPRRHVNLLICPEAKVTGDSRMLRIAMENLLRNAWKFSRNKQNASIEFGIKPMDSNKIAYYVKDNGSGFDMSYSHNLFRAFHRLHNESEFEGTGIGLATVHRIINRHGGKIWAKSQVGQGAEFYFEIPNSMIPIAAGI